MEEIILSKNINDIKYCVLDTETTGFDASSNKIIEISIAKILNSYVIGSINYLINPEIPIPQSITELTGITEDMIKNQPLFGAVADDIIEFIGDSVIVGHNIHFDLRFINTELIRNGYNPLQNIALCTCKLSRRIYYGLHRYDLDSVSNFLGFGFFSRHRAFDDVRVTAMIFEDLLVQAQLKSILTLGSLINFNNRTYNSIKQSQRTPRFKSIADWIPPE